jgi:hypothetical protein
MTPQTWNFFSFVYFFGEGSARISGLDYCFFVLFFQLKINRKTLLTLSHLAQQAYALPKIVEKDGFNISLWSSMEQIH